ncbi:MarR family winged helix-turn-helix transcriptional regulator [Sandaracinobacteroides hominis]|uniref:MarR family winged helix-turn-helix transcriptional regulator n=1 Tax=Sandaracinobacteroides hominis TaxID=2780086 RepID=UPI0018F6EEB4|nr:MarR family transcriptional regulator [Sandaracinobacteroides hominis]
MLTAAERSLYDLLVRLSGVEQLGRARIEAALPPGLTLAQLGVLGLLVKEEKGSGPLELARSFGVTKQTMTTTVARLQRSGLVDVCRNPADGRGKLVTITWEGAAVQRSCMERLGPSLAITADRMPLDLADRLGRVLEELEQILAA